MKTLNPAVARVLKRLHYPLDVILTCVRWYVAYPLSLRHLEEMMAERGGSVDHSTVHVHNLNAGQKDPRTAMSFESQHGSRAGLARAM